MTTMPWHYHEVVKPATACREPIRDGCSNSHNRKIMDVNNSRTARSQQHAAESQSTVGKVATARTHNYNNGKFIKKEKG
jgi:hypothetical protein